MPILWLFPVQALLPDIFSSVCDWLPQLLVQESEASVTTEHTAENCASVREGM